MERWSVISLHVNVRTGDCAIHLLFSTVTKTVEAAVLVDGGTKNQLQSAKEDYKTDSRTPLKRAIDRINGKFNFRGPKKLQFDSIVVTHWDEDHYGGLVSTFKTDLVNKVIPYLKFDLSDSKNPIPQTVLYAPNLNWFGSQFNGLSKDWIYNQDTGYVCIPAPPPATKPPAPPTPFAIFRCAENLKNDLGDVLGVNFFNNMPLKSADLENMSPSELLRRNPPSDNNDGRPGMYCVGVMKKTFKNIPTTGQEASKPAGLPEIVKERITMTNQVSIAAMIMWVSEDDEPPRIAHYFAGDMDELTEALILDWLEEGGVKRVTSAKLSHHGSRSSTPLRLYEVMNPVNLIISNPSGNYFHPGWEVVVTAALWARLRSYDTKQPPMHIWATKYPFYFAKDAKNNYPVVKVPRMLIDTKGKVKSFQTNTKYTKAFQDWLKSKYDEIGRRPKSSPEIDEYSQYLKDLDLKNGEENQKLMAMVQKRWDSYCSPPPNSHPSSASGYTFPLMSKIDSSKQVEFIQLVHIARSKIPIVLGFATYKIYGEEAGHSAARPTISNATHSTATSASSGSNQFGTPSAWTASSSSSSSNSMDLVAQVDPDTDPMVPGNNENEMDQDDDLEDDSILKTTAKFPSGKSEGSSTLTSPKAITSLSRSDPPTGDPWYFYANSVTDEQIQTLDPSIASSYSRMTSSLALDAFVSSLRCAVINLEQRPPVVPDPSSTTLLQQDIDEWACWLQDAVNASLISVINAPGQMIGGFAFAVTLNAPLDGSAIPTVLLFSSAAATLANAFYPATTPVMGLLPDSYSLVLGLEPQPPQPTAVPVTLSDIIKYIALGSLLDGDFMSVLQYLEISVPDSTDASKGRRNAVWFQPLDAYRTTIRLEFDLSPQAIEDLNSYLSLLDLNLENGFIIARKTCTWGSNPTNVFVNSRGALTLGAQATVAGEALDMTLTLYPDGMVMILTLNSQVDDFLDVVLNWLMELLNLQEDPFTFKTLQGRSASSTTLGAFDFRRLTIELQHDAVSQKATLSALRIDMQLTITFSSGSDPLLFLITYRYVPIAGQSVGQSSSLEADLWCAPPFDVDNEYFRLLPDFENFELLKPVPENPEIWPKFLDLAAIGGFDNAPSAIPTLVTQAKLQAGAGGITFTGTLRAKQEQLSDVPIFSIDEIDLFVGYLWGSSQTESGQLDASLGITALLQPPSYSTVGTPTQITGSIEYYQGTWTLKGSVEQLYASSLVQFFDDSIQQAVIPLIESIEIAYLDVIYTYSNGIPSKFDISGIILIGALQFFLKYHHEGQTWTFDANMQPADDPTTTSLGDVLTSVVGSVEDLPTFVTETRIVPDPNKDVLGLHMAPVTSEDTSAVSSIFFTVFMQLDEFSFQYIQYRNVQTDASVDQPPLKRIFIVSIDTLPAINVPLVGDVPQPFDEAMFMWVQPQPGSNGLTKTDLTLINNQIQQLNQAQNLNQQPILWQHVKKDELVQDTDVLIQNGMHLVLILHDDQGTPSIALDYIFNNETELTTLTGADSSPGQAGAGMVPYEKSSGPLAVRNLGFGYSTSTDGLNDVISVKVDAIITLGPVTFELLGFHLDLAFPKNQSGEDAFTLHNLPAPSFRLDGMGAAFDRAPLAMSGLLEHVDDGTNDFFEGSVSVSYAPWSFQASGYYGQTGGQDGFTSAFVYCILTGPLITLEFAEITGITGGFGYNTSLTYPNANNVSNFPFLLIPPPDPTAPPGSGPLGALNALINGPWFSTQKGSFWVAAGLTVTAFEMLTVVAVVCVEWDPNVKLGIFGIVTGDIPSSVGSEPKFAHVQFGIVATVDFASGVMKIDGQLTPTSYIFNPDCHLTGGFALYSWFDSNDESLKGDWVYTVGGYHPAYHVPPQYPNPSRLAISWQYDGSISISGQAYFAITPKVCMGGGRLDLSMSVGPLGAWFDAFADFLINYKPFHFIAEGGLSVGVSFTLDLWIVTIHINVEIGATLFIAGPPMYGTVHVDFWVFGFDINFGSSDNKLDPLKLDQFIDLVCQADLNSQEPVTTKKIEEVEDDEDPRSPHVFVIEDGLFPLNDSQSQPSGGPWFVRAATFSFAISCKFAVQYAKILTSLPTGGPPIYTDIVRGTGQDIHAKPMQKLATNVTSVLTVTIKPDPTPDPLGLSDEISPVGVWKYNVAIVKNLPLALWGPYDSSSDPSYNTNPDALLNGISDKTIPLMAGVSISRPEPQPSGEVENHTFPAFDYKLAAVVDDIPHAQFPDFPVDPATFLPLQPDTTKGGKQWDLIADSWESPRQGLDAAQKAVATWMNAVGLPLLGWDPAKVDSSKQEALTGALPTSLVENLDTYYMYASTLCASAA